jgi:uncharacterized protein
MYTAGELFAVAPLVRFADLARESLAAAREEIDALNVYPVPDGDTGTNLFLTFESAHQALVESLVEQGGPETADLPRTIAAYSRGLLLGARGNSGVIMSQLVGAMLRRIATARPEERATVVLAEAMAASTEAGYAAVGTPVEGTMLTVSRAASEEAVRLAADPAARIEQVLEGCARVAAEACSRTIEQLEVLRNAGVIDAGGRGLCLVLDAAETAFTGRRELARHDPLGTRTIPIRAAAPTGDLTEDGPAYEVMYLLEAEDTAVAELRTRLMPMGDSLVVVGGDGLWNVHVHVDDVGAAVEAGIEAGRPYRIRVTHFAEQIAQRRGAQETADAQRDGRAVVVLGFGAGLATIFQDAGATVVGAGVDSRPSTGQLLEAVLGTGAAEVVLLPNDRDVVPAAEAAARIAQDDHGVRAAVIPTAAQVQGMAALAVHEPGRQFEHDLVEMTAAARHARSGAVTVAARRAITSAGPCEPGDVLGAVEGDFVVVGSDLELVAIEVMDRMLGGGGELFTILQGVGGEQAAARCVDYLSSAHPTVDVLLYDGGQDRYPLLFGVE